MIFHPEPCFKITDNYSLNNYITNTVIGKYHKSKLLIGKLQKNRFIFSDLHYFGRFCIFKIFVKLSISVNLKIHIFKKLSSLVG
ncbi:hypothetical protein BHF70_07120 [Anaerostipes sp. 494a]|nr:hypothetical protein BHF70_07120 [Anaerostipes sp. 494a]